MLLLALLPALAMAAADGDEAKKKINSIKKNSRTYLYAEATAPTEQEAHDLAEEILYDEINAWAATKKKLQKSSNFVINNRQSLWTTVTLPRGNMKRAFIYVKKSDILPAETSEVIENANPVVDDTPLTSTVETVYPEAVTTLAACTEYADLVAKIQQMKANGQLKSYARYAKLDNPDTCYLAIYNQVGKIVAVLSPGQVRHNVGTGKVDGIVNYSGCGAIGFEVNE